jgi:hypothetical protein
MDSPDFTISASAVSVQQTDEGLKLLAVTADRTETVVDIQMTETRPESVLDLFIDDNKFIWSKNHQSKVYVYHAS